MEETTALEELTALANEALTPYFDDSDTSKYARLFARDATYFDPNSSGRLEGNAIGELFAAYAGSIPPDRFEILDPDVTIHGDVAVFTYNLDTFSREDGSVTSRWNTTEIPERSADGCDMTHAHWSHREPMA